MIISGMCTITKALSVKNSHILCREGFGHGCLKAVLPIISPCLSKRSNAAKPERIEATMLKMLATRQRLQNKTLYQRPSEPTRTLNSTSFADIQPKGKVNKSIMQREKTVSAMLLRELQETIDSGQVGEELKNLHVKFNSAVLSGKYSCLVSWESLGYEADLMVQNELQSHSSLLRHTIMHSHVLGIVPQFTFCMDSSIEKEKKLSDALRTVSRELEQLDTDEENMENNRDVQKMTINEADSSFSNPTFDMFGMDSQLLRNKILAKKSTTSQSSTKEIDELLTDTPDAIDQKKDRILNIFNE